MAVEGLVVFRLGNERYAVPLSAVRELGRVPPVTPVPLVPNFVAGVANLRGIVLGLIELRAVFGVESRGDEAHRRMMVVQVDGVTAGVLVDRVEGVMELDREVDPPVPTLPESFRPFVRGHFQQGDSTIAVLEPSLFVALRERVEVEAR